MVNATSARVRSVQDNEERAKSDLVWRSEILEFLAKCLWPLITIVLLTSFWTPLHMIAKKLPNLLDRATQVRIGNLSVALIDQSRIQTSPEVQAASKGMTNIALRRMMQLTQAGGGLTHCNIDSDRSSYEDYVTADKELERRGLASKRPSPSQDQAHYSDCYVVNSTDLGRQTQEFLVSLLVLGVSPSSDK